MSTRYNVCRNFQQGYCRFGDRCRFSHHIPPPNTAIYEGIDKTKLHSFIQNNPSSTQSNNLLNTYHPKLIGSYSWLRDSENPDGIKSFVLMPAIPSKMANFTTSELSERTLHFMYDKLWPADANMSLHNDFPMEPVFAALDFSKFEISSSDKKMVFITDRHNLRLIAQSFMLTHGIPTYYKQFRIDLERVGNMIIAVRKDIEVLAESERDRFGPAFENACHDHSNIDTSTRLILSGKFGAVDLITRLEVGILRDGSPVPTNFVCPNHVNTPKWKDGSLLSVAKLYQLENPKLEDAVELKSSKNPDPVANPKWCSSIWPQLFFGGIPNVFLAKRNEDGNIFDTKWLTPAEILDGGNLQLKNRIGNVLEDVHHALNGLFQTMKDGEQASLLSLDGRELKICPFAGNHVLPRQILEELRSKIAIDKVASGMASLKIDVASSSSSLKK
jgi:hypothetical protein